MNEEIKKKEWMLLKTGMGNGVIKWEINFSFSFWISWL